MKATAPGCLICGVVLALLAAPAAAEDKKADKTGKPAKLIIQLVADATLRIDKQVTRQSGDRREFETPPLKPGVRYFYHVEAVWEPNNYTKITRTRKVFVKGGDRLEIDLTKEDPAQPDDIFVRYVPTPQGVVDAMLKLGKVGAGDVVYDLGCGDGRIPVTAVAKFKARRGVGVDLDAQRIKESKDNAREAKVEAKVEFRQADVLKIRDLSDASVVTLYLGDDINLQLKPILEKTLKPGSRIVSHRFLIGDWKPEKTETIDVAGVPYQIHLWTIKGEGKKRE